MTIEELLSQLKDIKEPVQPGWWPLASGWWYLIALSVFIAMTVHFLKKRRIANQPFVSASEELQNLKQAYINDNDDSKLAHSLSSWLKRVALFAYPEKSLAGLTGQAWLTFLDESAGNSDFSQGPGQVFAQSIYDKSPRLEGSRLVEICEKWLLQVKPQLLGQDIH